MGFLQRLQDMLGMNDELNLYDDDGSSDDGPGGAASPSDGRQDDSRRVPDNVIEMPGRNAGVSELIVMEPRSFEEIPEAIVALRDRKTVILNLSYMDADQAQRSVDYVAGGVFAIDGHQERIGRSVFLFTPSTVQISTYTPAPVPVPYNPATPRPTFSPPSREQAMLEQLEARARHSREDLPQSEAF
ncbi:MAG: cell division protein SepF [Synechococcales bacterium]|nr:cell division protein SepF [Synechococcales bacterium]